MDPNAVGLGSLEEEEGWTQTQGRVDAVWRWRQSRVPALGHEDRPHQGQGTAQAEGPSQPLE